MHTFSYTNYSSYTALYTLYTHIKKGFPKIRKAVMTVQFGGKTKEAKLKDLYDDIAANEKEWLTFLDHPISTLNLFLSVWQYVMSMQLFNMTRTKIGMPV